MYSAFLLQGVIKKIVWLLNKSGVKNMYELGEQYLRMKRYGLKIRHFIYIANPYFFCSERLESGVRGEIKLQSPVGDGVGPAIL